MRNVRSLVLTATLAVLFTVSAAAAPALTEFLPADSLLVLHADNSAESRRLWQASPWAKTWQDEQVQRFFAPLLAGENFAELRENIKKETGKSLEEFLELFNSQVSVALTRMELTMGGRTPEKIHLVMLLELGEKRALLEDMLKHGEHKNERTEEFRGVTITEEVEEGKPEHPDAAAEENFCHAIVGDYWVAGVPKKAVQELIVAIQQGGEVESLAKSAAFTNASQRAGQCPTYLYCHAARLLSLFRDALEAESAEKLEKNPRSNPMGLTPTIVFRALGLDAVEGLYIGAVVQEDHTDTHFALTYTEERGLTKLFSASNGDVALPAWVRPAWPKAAVLQLPVTHVYSVIEEIVQGLNPGLFTMMQGQLQMMQQNTGVDLKRDLVGVLGDTLVAGYVPKPGEGEAELLTQGENLIAISTANPHQLQATMETLGNMGGKLPKSMFETRDYLGATIYSIPANPRMPQNAFAFTIHEGWFIMSVVPGAHPIEAVLQAMHQTDGPSLWEQPQVRQVMAELPAHSFGYAYQDIPAILAGACSLLADLQGKMDVKEDAPEEPQLDDEGNEVPAEDAPPPKAKKPTKFVDPTQRPTVELFRRYWSTSIGGNWHDAHSFTATTRISHRPAKP